MARKLAKILKDTDLIGNAQEIINLYKKYPNIFSINKDKLNSEITKNLLLSHTALSQMFNFNLSNPANIKGMNLNI